MAAAAMHDSPRRRGRRRRRLRVARNAAARLQQVALMRTKPASCGQMPSAPRLLLHLRALAHAVAASMPPRVSLPLLARPPPQQHRGRRSTGRRRSSGASSSTRVAAPAVAVLKCGSPKKMSATSATYRPSLTAGTRRSLAATARRGAMGGRGRMAHPPRLAAAAVFPCRARTQRRVLKVRRSRPLVL